MVRSTSRIAADSGCSSWPAKLFEGAPVLALPPEATIIRSETRRPFASNSWITSSPLVAWFSSDRGRPRTMSMAVQLSGPVCVIIVMTPELVSRLLSLPLPPAPMRLSDEVTYMVTIGVPSGRVIRTPPASYCAVTSMPVTWRFTPPFSVPSSLWFWIAPLIRSTVTASVT